MKRTIKTFADLRAAIAEVAAETPSVAAPPMTTAELRDQARAFVEYRRNVALEPASRPPAAAASGKPVGDVLRAVFDS
jgi:hypothetical protein